MKLRPPLLLVLASSFLFGCEEPTTQIERGFYYWKSEGKGLDSLEEAYLKELKVDRLYVKFFDVVPDDRIGSRPVAKTKLEIPEEGSLFGEGKSDRSLSIVPTVFIRNDVLKDIEGAAIDSLAHRIEHLCEELYEERFSTSQGRGFEELQIDCDWTPSTREAYFKLLERIKTRSDRQLSVTLRLYPFKYPEKMGVPPADRASLMCYNLFHPLKYEGKNSVQDPAELDRYLKGSKGYPLSLDIVLPLFSRVHWFQNKRFVKSLDMAPASVQHFSERADSLWYEVEKDTVIQDHYLRRGDRLKVEKVSQERMKRMTHSLKEELELGPKTTIAFFDLDRKDIARFDHETLHRFYTAFSDSDP